MIKWLKSQNRTILQFIVVLLISFPLLGERIPVISIVLLGLVSFIFHKGLLKNFNLLLGLSLTFPLLYLYQYFIDPTHVSWFIFEKKMSLIFVPLIFANLSRNSIKKDLPFQISIAVSTLLIIIGLGNLSIFGVSETAKIGGISYGIRTTIESVLSIHPTYLSLIISFSGGMLFSYLMKNKNRNLNLFLIFLIIIHIGFILLLASRIALLGLIILLLFTGLFYRSQLKSKLKYLFVALLLIAGASWTIPSSHERIHELITSVSSTDQIETNSTNIRHSIYYCSALILEQNWIYGLGTSQLQNHLNSCYYMVYSYDMLDRNYNTHNEFLNIWIGLGLIGITLFIALISISFYYAKGNYIHLVFLILFSLYCLTENLLERQMGVFFFTIWFSYFNFYVTPINDTKIT